MEDIEDGAESEKDSSEEEKREEAEVRNVSDSSFVIVKYEEEFYPGKVINKENDAMLLISTMIKSGADWK